MKRLNEEEVEGFRLLSNILANKTSFNEREKTLVSNLIVTCIKDRSFNKRFNQALPYLLSVLENKEAVMQAADMLTNISFRTRGLRSEVKNFIQQAKESYTKSRH